MIHLMLEGIYRGVLLCKKKLMEILSLFDENRSLVMTIPVSFLFYYCETILLLAGQDAEISRLAGLYIIVRTSRLSNT